MGLDMYLDKELYVSKYCKDSHVIDEIYNMLNVKDTSDNFAHLSVKLPAIYWRKANQIHNWFVENIQKGKDDGDQYDVDIDDLKELLKQIKQQLKNKTIITLQPKDGFFFGSTEINDDYWDDLKTTKTNLETEISFYEDQAKLDRHWTYNYRASW